jgi:hypothetical protein
LKPVLTQAAGLVPGTASWKTGEGRGKKKEPAAEGITMTNALLRSRTAAVYAAVQ